MTWISIIALVFSAVGIGISIWAVMAAKTSNKAVMRQNLEIELAGIERELADIEVQIEREKSAGNEHSSHIYGVMTSSPHICEINALWNKKEVLLKRKKQIKQQL